jgi:hypothetical protein
MVAISFMVDAGNVGTDSPVIPRVKSAGAETKGGWRLVPSSSIRENYILKLKFIIY